MLSGLKSPVTGDGIVSVDYAHLPGAVQLTLDGVFHSINAPNDYWYGGEAVIDKWMPIVKLALLKSKIGAKLSTLLRGRYSKASV